MDDLDDVIRFFEGALDQLSNPQAFFRAHEERYLTIARNVGVQTIVALRPVDQQPDVWRESAIEFAELIFSKLLTPGLEIIFAGHTEFSRAIAATAGNGKNFTPITYRDVLEWVQAGSENGGKDLTAIESARERSPHQIAYDVFHAIRQHRLGFEKKDFSRITQRLEDWVNSRVAAGDLGGLLEAVLEAWLGALEAIIERDFVEWIELDVLDRR